MNNKFFTMLLLGVVTFLGASSAWATTNPWDSMFTDAGSAISALGTSASTLIGLVFSAIVLLLVGFKLVKTIANKV